VEVLQGALATEGRGDVALDAVEGDAGVARGELGRDAPGLAHRQLLRLPPALRVAPRLAAAARGARALLEVLLRGLDARGVLIQRGRLLVDGRLHLPQEREPRRVPRLAARALERLALGLVRLARGKHGREAPLDVTLHLRDHALRIFAALPRALLRMCLRRARRHGRALGLTELVAQGGLALAQARLLGLDLPAPRRILLLQRC
jgi:hypothetical protein